MFRLIFVSVLLSACAIAGVWLLVPHLNSAPPSPPPATAAERKESERRPAQQLPPRSTMVAMATRGQPEVIVYRNNNRQGVTEPIIIPDGTLVIVEKQEVSSEKEGTLLFIGTEMRDGEMVPPHKQLPAAQLGFLALPVGDNPIEGENCFQFPNEKTWYRRARATDDLKPNQVRLASIKRQVRKLQVGDRVTRGQLLALVNPAKSFDQVAEKVAKLNAVEIARQAAAEQEYEYKRRLNNYLATNRSQPRAIAEDSIQETRLQMVKFGSEKKVKEAEILEAQSALRAALTDLKLHEVHAAIDGHIKEIYKNHQGDAVKPSEKVLEIQNRARLRVDGRLDLQEALNLKEGMTAIVEASRPDAPRLVIGGHLDTVNCVAVSKGKQPVIVSGSKDESLRGWDPITGDHLWAVRGLRSAVCSVACTPPSSNRNLVCFGCADGTVRLLDLDNNNTAQKPREMSERHRGPVHAVAFSPDGEMIATGGEDRYIRLWKTETGALLHFLTNHSAPVTSVQFASAKRLVSAAKDYRLLVWDVEAGKPPRLSGPRFDGRGGEVPTLGVSPDGKTVLFDQGKELRLLTLEDRQIVGTLQNPAEGKPFSTMALFSPDGKTILTNGSAPGKLQLWRTPVTQLRGSELRQFVWSKGTATCGAFAPQDSSFAVTGTQDHKVLVWSMPSKEEIDSRLEGRLTLVEHSLDTDSLKVRVWAEVESPEWLIPGMRATMVVPPQQK